MSKINKLLEEVGYLQNQINELGFGKSKEVPQDTPQDTEDQEEYQEPSQKENLLGEIRDHLSGMLSEVRNFMSDVYDYASTEERFIEVWKEYDKLNYFNSKVSQIKGVIEEYIKMSPSGLKKALGFDDVSRTAKLLKQHILLPLESIMVNTEEIKIEQMLMDMIIMINQKLGVGSGSHDYKIDLDDELASKDPHHKIRSDALDQREEVQQIINRLRPIAMKRLASVKKPKNLQEAWEQLEKTLR